MYCEECGQLVTIDMFGKPIHDYQTRDMHAPVVEGLTH